MDSKTNFELINDLIMAISHLLWPILVFVLVLIFKKEINKLIPRIKHWKMFGNEIEIEIDNLKNEVEKTSNQTPDTSYKTESFSFLVNQNPKMALISLAIEIEKEMKILVATTGVFKGRRYISLQQSFDLLYERGVLSKDIKESIRIFWDLRNKLVHGKDEEDENIIRVLDIGIKLLNTIKTTPHEINKIYMSDVDVYKDEGCKDKIINATGVIIETISSDNKRVTYKIFPTTRIKYYIKGKIVSWDWDLSKTWSESWYVDPITKDIKQAWLSSGNFIGSHIDEI